MKNSLPEDFSNDILEFNNKLFLARNNGLYVKNIVSGIDNPDDEENSLEIFSNPSDGEVISISSAKPVIQVKLMNGLGQILFSERIGQSKFSIHPDLEEGIYFVNLFLSDGQSITKNLMVQ